MATITIAGKAKDSVLPFVSAAAVTAVTVAGTPVAFTNSGGGTIRLAAPLSADASIVLTYDATNPNAGAIEHRLLEIMNRLAALEA